MFKEILAKFKNVKITEDAAQNPVIELEAQELLPLINLLKKNGFTMLTCISGTDFREYIELDYFLYSPREVQKLMIKIKINSQDAKIDSLARIFKSADWSEREIFDLLGVEFENHPNPKRLLMPEDWVGHPLKKDYVNDDKRLVWNERN